LRMQRALRSCVMPGATSVLGVLEAATIYYAVTMLGKHAVLAFISVMMSLGIAGLIVVSALRILLVFLAWKWEMRSLLVALAVWWGAWSIVNLS